MDARPGRGTNESSAPAHVDRDTELERVAGGATGFPAGLKSPICESDPAALTATCIRRGFHHRPDGASRNAPSIWRGAHEASVKAERIRGWNSGVDEKVFERSFLMEATDRIGEQPGQGDPLQRESGGPVVGHGDAVGGHQATYR